MAGPIAVKHVITIQLESAARSVNTLGSIISRALRGELMREAEGR